MEYLCFLTQPGDTEELHMVQVMVYIQSRSGLAYERCLPHGLAGKRGEKESVTDMHFLTTTKLLQYMYIGYNTTYVSSTILYSVQLLPISIHSLKTLLYVGVVIYAGIIFTLWL